MESSDSLLPKGGQIMLIRDQYCQFLLSTQTNYTQTYYSEHTQGLSHDQLNRYLRRDQIKPSLVWEETKKNIVQSDAGYVVFDDTVLNKKYSYAIESVRRQWSGNTHSIIKGIGVVTCIYVNPETDQFWMIDFRIFDPDKDGKTKIDHLMDMLDNLHYHKNIKYKSILVDSWYSTKKIMLFIDKELKKIFYCPLKSNRLVNDSDGNEPNKNVSELNWTEQELSNGKVIKIKGFPVDCIWKLFRMPVSSDRTDFVVTNDKTCNTTDDARIICANRWKIEQLHREVKQNCGIEKCQCRKGRAQRNHIACAFLVFVRLKQIAYETFQNIYQIKKNLLQNYMKTELKNPSVVFKPA